MWTRKSHRDAASCSCYCCCEPRRRGQRLDLHPLSTEQQGAIGGARCLPSYIGCALVGCGTRAGDYSCSTLSTNRSITNTLLRTTIMRGYLGVVSALCLISGAQSWMDDSDHISDDYPGEETASSVIVLSNQLLHRGPPFSLICMHLVCGAFCLWDRPFSHVYMAVFGLCLL